MDTARLAIATGILLTLGAGCAATRQYTVTGTERAAGADAQVRVERLETGNYEVRLRVDNLLPPDRVQEGANAYVVWLQPSDQTPTRAGVLDYNDGNRRGELMATTVETAFTLTVTAESAPDVPAPSDRVVVRATVEAP